MHKELRLLDNDALMLNRTVVIQSPEMHSSESVNKLFTYDCFPEKFNDELFETEYLLNQQKKNLRSSSLHNIESGKKNSFLFENNNNIKSR